MRCEKCDCEELVTKHKSERGDYLLPIDSEQDYLDNYKSIPIYCISCNTIVNEDNLCFRTDDGYELKNGDIVSIVYSDKIGETHYSDVVIDYSDKESTSYVNYAHEVKLVSKYNE